MPVRTISCRGCETGGERDTGAKGEKLLSEKRETEVGARRRTGLKRSARRMEG